jgi:hypothetical protein
VHAPGPEAACICLRVVFLSVCVLSVCVFVCVWFKPQRKLSTFSLLSVGGPTLNTWRNISLPKRLLIGGFCVTHCLSSARGVVVAAVCLGLYRHFRGVGTSLCALRLSLLPPFVPGGLPFLASSPLPWAHAFASGHQLPRDISCLACGPREVLAIDGSQVCTNYGEM